MVYYSQRYADKQKYERDKMIEKAKDLVSHPKRYTSATSYGAAGYINNIAYDKDTGEVKMEDAEIRRVYKGLIEIEHTFRVTKTNLEARHVYVWTKEHIEAHFLTCFISIVILRLVEYKLDKKIL